MAYFGGVAGHLEFCCFVVRFFAFVAGLILVESLNCALLGNAATLRFRSEVADILYLVAFPREMALQTIVRVRGSGVLLRG